MKQEVIDSIIKNKLIVIVRGVEREKLIPLVEALYKGGVRLLEITFDASGRTSDEQTAENIKMLAREFDGRMYIGAGTVICERQAELTKNAGGRFIISPDTYENVIKRTNELGMVSIPGALTPSEVRCATRCGADFVKLFPVGSFGVSYVKALTAPLNDVKLLAVGGITENNMAEYLNSGIYGFGISSGIVKKDLINAGDFEGITRLALKYMDILKYV